MKSCLIILFNLLFLSVVSFAEPAGDVYRNNRFGFSVDVPSGLLVSNRSVDGSSVTWQTGTVRMQVSGSNNPYRIKPHEYYERVRTAAGDGFVTHRKNGADSLSPWYEILYTHNGRRIHQRVYVGAGSINTVSFSYAYRYRKEKEGIGWRVLESFKPGDLTRSY